MKITIYGWSTSPRVHGRMTDSAYREDRYQPHKGRSWTIWPYQDKRSVRPSAKPTLVRTQHLPPITLRSISRSAWRLGILFPPAQSARAHGLQTARSSRATVRDSPPGHDLTCPQGNRAQPQLPPVGQVAHGVGRADQPPPM